MKSNTSEFFRNKGQVLEFFDQVTKQYLQNKCLQLEGFTNVPRIKLQQIGQEIIFCIEAYLETIKYNIKKILNILNVFLKGLFPGDIAYKAFYKKDKSSTCII